MANPPSPSDVYNNANGMRLDSRTPGLNIAIQAWAAAQNFTGAWAVNTYNQQINIANQIAGLFA